MADIFRIPLMQYTKLCLAFCNFGKNYPWLINFWQRIYCLWSKNDQVVLQLPEKHLNRLWNYIRVPPLGMD